ncbi:hypothetical protein Patl1_20772 [Pistacia atlantica]|uniref:Uncharacterized protein n=1 Tax=Pistacia atlantica TaxID=434234 RepID=A0ACC1BMV2_9ROSI|nr:hypothetical protein Patl1_20772 [Pistacia atlantica]
MQTCAKQKKSMYLKVKILQSSATQPPSTQTLEPPTSKKSSTTVVSTILLVHDMRAPDNSGGRPGEVRIGHLQPLLSVLGNPPA